jgi:hypothetical protein
MSSETREHEPSLEFIPLSQLAHSLYRIIVPIVILLGYFGNVMTIVVMRRVMTSSNDAAVTLQLFFVGTAVADLTFLTLGPVLSWIRRTFRVDLYVLHTASCKVSSSTIT